MSKARIGILKSAGFDMRFEPVIGLEVHVQLDTETKMFCSCANEFGAEPNSRVCPVCLGLPGVLPVVNEKVIELAVRAALALNCRVSGYMKFDRKNYYYPDLPKNFQISQFDKPLAHDGFLDIPGAGEKKRIRIKRIHLEEDAGKLIHAKGASLVDFNRTGTPLIEIVTEPDICSPEEAYSYLAELKGILLYLEVSDCNMEQGSLRCDANVSLRPEGEKGLGVKTEVKNMNTFKGVRDALDFEIRRQSGILSGHKSVSQETRLWNADKAVTISMRSKEYAHDYRYFPEPDLVPFVIPEDIIEEVRKGMPEMPSRKKDRFMKDYGLSEYDSEILTKDKKTADFFENSLKLHNDPKTVANWLMGEVLAQVNKRGLSGIVDLPIREDSLVRIIKMEREGAITGSTAKAVLKEYLETGKEPDLIIKEQSLAQIRDEGQIGDIVTGILSKNEKSVNDYRSGKKNALMFLVGQVMRESKGKADPKKVAEILKEKLQ
jgi:aspartyl-tRNA(Asn)/glutamyl-tRNA(Gln) amidotransferase subunit B